MNVKNGEIILCKGIKLDKEYENVLSYSESDMVTLCRDNKIAVASNYTINYSIIDPTIKSIDVAIPYVNCIYANYIAFRNPNYGNKWIFAFVNNVKYVSPNTTTIEYTIDVFSTWYSKMNVGKVFVEREHVSDDTIGKHTLQEPLNAGDFIVNGHGQLDEYGNSTHVIIGVTKVPADVYNIQGELVNNKIQARTSNYNGVFSGLTYFAFQYPSDASQFVAMMDLNGLADNIVNVFLAPVSIFSSQSWDPYTYDEEVAFGNLHVHLAFNYKIIPNTNSESVLFSGKTITINNTLDGYTPKNNKMFTKQFNYVYMTNNNGGDIVYAYEDFKNYTPKFRGVGTISPGCSVRLIPEDYKKWDTSNANYTNDLIPFGIVGGKYPTCSWRSDTYTNWITQQSINNQITLGKVVGTGAAASISPETAIASTAGAFMEGLMESQDKEELMPVVAKGNTNVGDVTYACGKTNFEYYQMSCKNEYAQICDQFLSRYGYKVNEIKTPNLLSRTKFNYIKIGAFEELITGDIPASDLEEINNIFRKGVTIFHDYTTFGDYTQTNAIVTP